MQTKRAVLNERTAKRKISSYHKICTYEHPTPYFESEKLHCYEFTHIKSPPEQLIFNKHEVPMTNISLPTPPAAPEFYGTSLQKWYQKKPLFTLTAKGQVKRLEKYLQIQKTLEMCKKEHEFQVNTQEMKRAYVDFEFREHQPLLYEDKDICCVCPCNSSRNYDVDFIPVDYRTCSPHQHKFCVCPEEKTPVISSTTCREISKSAPKTPSRSSEKPGTPEPIPYEPTPASGTLVDEDKVIPTKLVKEGQEDVDDRGIFKIVVKNKAVRRAPDAKYLIKLFDNKNYAQDENAFYAMNTPNPFMNNNSSSNCFFVSKITLDNVATLPFDDFDEELNIRRQSSCRSSRKSSRRKFDVNRNEIS